MSDDQELPVPAAPMAAPVEPVPVDPSLKVAGLSPRVHWIPAAALQIVAGGIAGFVVPLFLFGSSGSHSDLSGQLIWIVVSLVSAGLVGVFGGGIPLLTAWGSWLIVSHRGRRLRREVLAVVLGAIGGGLIASAPAFLFLAAGGSPWPYFVGQVLLVGGVPGLAFAIWVAAAWHRVRKVVSDSLN
jgi:hypothetical protein